jgi:F-type H+-transporting ATPase subunit b
MPQLDPSGFLPQLFWLAITFITLYLVLSRISLPRVSRIREHRANRISGDLNAAASMKAEADAAKAAYEAALAEQRDKAKALSLRTREAIKANSEARLREVDTKIAADADAAEARILAAKTQALAGVQDAAAEAARDIVAKVAGLTLDDAVVRAAVAADLKNIEGAR